MRSLRQRSGGWLLRRVCHYYLVLRQADEEKDEDKEGRKEIVRIPRM